MEMQKFVCAAFPELTPVIGVLDSVPPAGKGTQAAERVCGVLRSIDPKHTEFDVAPKPEPEQAPENSLVGLRASSGPLSCHLEPAGAAVCADHHGPVSAVDGDFTCIVYAEKFCLL